MRLGVLLLTLGFAALGSSVASASTHDADVSILIGSFATPRLDVLVGDTVTWRNSSLKAHTVTATDGSWASGQLTPNASFSHRFDGPGAVAYYCQVHPFMRGEVDVHRLLLDAPDDAATPGRPFALSGRAALPAGSNVAIEAGDGALVATATVEPDGVFHAHVTSQSTTTLRAVAGSEASPPVQVLVLDRKVAASARSRHHRVTVRTRVRPASPGTTVVLQLRLKERFGWWPVKRTRLDAASRARFTVRPRHAVRARVVLTASDGATVLARSATLRLTPR
jgi:plastocyanin